VSGFFFVRAAMLETLIPVQSWCASMWGRASALLTSRARDVAPAEVTA
jgi:hypothetical protein